MAGTTFQQLLDGVANYYGSGSDQWVKIAQYGVTTETLPIIEQVPGVNISVSDSGKFLGFDYSNPFPASTSPTSIVNSNVQTGVYGDSAFNAQLPATAVTDQTTGITTMQSGARSVSLGSTVATIADKASLAVAGVALGTKLGKFIDSAIYSIAPDWWDEHFPSINPQTWDDMSTTQGGQSFIRSIFGIENNNATMYLDERMLAYTYMMLLANGAYSSGNGQATFDPPSDFPEIGLQQPIYFTSGADILLTRLRYGNVYALVKFQTAVNAIPIQKSNSGLVIFYSSERATAKRFISYNNGATWQDAGNYSTSYRYTYNGKTVYMFEYSEDLVTPALNTGNVVSSEQVYAAIAWICLYGTVIEGELDGVSDNPQAGEHINSSSLINPTTGQAVTPEDSVDDVLQALKTYYPNLFDGAIYEDIPQPDGTIQRITYIPAPYPDTTNSQQPITDTTEGIDPQTTPQINPNTRTDALIQQLLDILTQDPVPPDTGDGNTPTVIIPTGSANALYSVYNPTQTELNNFGSWLWSSNFVDQLLKLFNDPMQAIIGLHKIFAPPVISGTSTIRVGYLDSGVSSNVVGNQYTTIDCGFVNMDEYFGNVFDYIPHTQIYIYLPFIGIEKLDTGDVMRGRVGVKYHVDVITGACLAEISVIRDGSGGVLYTFTGNCAVQYPISSGSYMGIVASLAGIAGGVVGSVVSGGALTPVAMGVIGGVLNAHTDVNRSGGFSGNAGAMGVKIPYLIITRPQICLADNFQSFEGFPSNKTSTVSQCSGFIKCSECHIENIPATDSELTEIETLLKTGIII